jgi:hypothetical protein
MRWSAKGLVGRGKAACVAYAAFGLVLVGTRFVAYGQSLWRDEIYSVEHYIVPGPAGSFAHYGANDHILFSLLCWLTVRLPGLGDSAYRLWAIVPFVVAVAVMIIWLRRRAGDAVALLFGGLATASPLLLDLSSSARGYGLAFLSMAVMTIAAYEGADRGRASWLSAFAVAGVVGCWTLPTFVLPFAGGTTALLLQRRLWRPLLSRLTLAACAIGALYAVPARALLATRGQEYGVQLPWHAPVTGALWELVGALFRLGSDEADPRMKVVLMVGVAPLLVVGWLAARRRMPRLGEVTVLPVLVTFLVLTATRFWVEVRFVSFLLVPLFVCAAFGLQELVSRAERRLWPLYAGYAGVIAMTVSVAFVYTTTLDAMFPLEANRDAAHAVATALGRSHGRLVVDTFHPSNILYYLPTEPPPAKLPAWRLERMLCSPRRGSFVLVEQPFGEVQSVGTACLVREGATVQIFRQRELGQRISVWVVPASPSGKQRPATRATTPLVADGST